MFSSKSGENSHVSCPLGKPKLQVAFLSLFLKKFMLKIDFLKAIFRSKIGFLNQKWYILTVGQEIDVIQIHL